MAGLPVGLTGTVRNAGGTVSAPASVIVNPFSITPGIEFATNAWCYQRLAANAPIDANSVNIVNTLLTAVGQTKLYNGMHIPQWVVPANTPTVAVLIDTPPTPPPQLIQQFQAVPMPAGFWPEDPTDSEAVIYQPSTGKLWEGWQWRKTGGQVRNSAGQLVDQWYIVWGGYEGSVPTSDGTWAPTFGFKPGMIATGIHWLSFSISLGDLKNQAINHPVGIVVPTGTARSDVWNRPPAWRCDGFPPQTDPNAIPEGGIFRLPANLNLNNYPETQWDGVSVKTHWRIVAEAMQNYGCVVYDQGGTWYMAGENQYVYGGGDIISNDPILYQVMGNPSPWGYAHQFTDVTQFPFSQLQLLQTNLVNSP